MKKTHTLIALLLFALACSAQSNGKIFIYLNSHNEDNIGYLNGPGGFINYTQTRAAMVQLAQLTQAKGAKQNWGSDHIALRAIAQYDTGSTLLSTNGKNLARWMSEDMGVECDPHSHENTYNYGDVAYFMNQLGVTPSGNISGFLFGQLQNGHNWEDYDDGIQGDSFPSYTWYPNVLWGGGSPNHVDDLNYYGCYKPKSMAEVNVHEPNKNLTLVGVGCHIKMDDTSTVAYNMSIIRRLVNAVQDGTLPADGLYTQEIMSTESKMKQPYYLPLMSEMLDSVNVLVAEGKVEWAHLSEIHDYWKNSYDSVPFVYDCDFNEVIGLPTTSVKNTNTSASLSVFPNPSTDALNIQFALDEAKPVTVALYDMSGRKLETLFEGTQCAGMHTITRHSSPVTSGVYFVKVNDAVVKWIKG